MLFRRGGRVVVRPGVDADLQARMLEGRVVTVERIYRDYDGQGPPRRERRRARSRDHARHRALPLVLSPRGGGACNEADPGRRHRQRLAARRRLRRRGGQAPRGARAARGRRGVRLRHRRARPRLRGHARLRRAAADRRQPPGRRAGHALRDGGVRGGGRGRDRGRPGDQPARHGPPDRAALRQDARRVARQGRGRRLRARRGRGDGHRAQRRGARAPSTVPSTWSWRRSRSCAPTPPTPRTEPCTSCRSPARSSTPSSSTRRGGT